jgi:hypothetical protein
MGTGGFWMSNQSNPVYERRVLAFLDILGFRSLIEDGREAELLLILKRIQREFAEADVDPNRFVAETAFSDSFVVSMKVDESGFPATALVAYVIFHICGMLSNGILVRGGIAVGDAYHRNGIVFGPAMNEAYKIENELAIYPRVVLSDAVLEMLEKESIESKLERGQLKQRMAALSLRDFDGMYFANFLGPLDDVKANGLSKRQVVQRVVDEGKKKFSKQPRQLAKYLWLENYLKKAK